MITAARVWKAARRDLSRLGLAIRIAAGARRDRHCPACGQGVAGFFRYGVEAEWGCPRCQASPRERLMHYLLDTGRITMPQGGSILHCAPNEASLVSRFRAAAGDYLPADIDPSRYAVEGIARIDLMDLGDEGRFDRLYASHVLEHVPDDARVLRNIAKALKPGGEAWLIVPLWVKPSEDGPANLSARQRERRFGQWDHVRQYGRDLADRIAQAGLSVETIDAAAMPAADVWQMALGDTLFRAVRCQ